MDDTTDLAQLRRDIDDIDDQMHDLLARRVALVSEIARIKDGESAEASPLRSEREAAILRRLAQRHNGKFPLGSLFRIYREIMAVSLQLQQRFCVSIWTGGNPALSDITRDFYGFSVPVTHEPDAHAVLERASKDAFVLGVLPLPGGDASGKWWIELVRRRPSPSIIGCLPFLLADGAGNSRALVVGSIQFVPSGEDTSLLAWSLVNGMDTRSAEASLLNNLGSRVWVLDSDENENQRLLLAARGHISGSDELLDPLRQHGALTFLGGYANPWREEDASWA